MRAFVSIATLALVLCGCTTSKITRFDELPPGSAIDRSPRSARYVAKGDRLSISPLDQNGVWLAGVEVQLLEGDVYLNPVNISSPATPPTITLDFSEPKFPRDWKARLYWIQNVAAFPIFAKERILYRKKIVPDEEKG